MTDQIAKTFSLDTGIEQILKSGESETAKLPVDRSAILPSDDHLKIQLNRLFNAPSLDDQILSLLKPALLNKNILIPARYQALLKSIQRKIKKAAEKNKSGKGERALAEAAELLEEEQELLELLNTYRNILHKA